MELKELGKFVVENAGEDTDFIFLASKNEDTGIESIQGKGKNLAFLLYHAMKRNEHFAKVVVTIATAFIEEKIKEEAQFDNEFIEKMAGQA